MISHVRSNVVWVGSFVNTSVLLIKSLFITIVKHIVRYLLNYEWLALGVFSDRIARGYVSMYKYIWNKRKHVSESVNAVNIQRGRMSYRFTHNMQSFLNFGQIIEYGHFIATKDVYFEFTSHEYRLSIRYGSNAACNKGVKWTQLCSSVRPKWVLS